MSKQHRNTRDYLCQRGPIANRLSRIRHFRGHGVHSPYVYSMVRRIFTKRSRANEPYDSDLAEVLQANGLSKRRSRELARVAAYCQFSTFELDTISASCDLAVVTSGAGSEATKEIVRRAKELSRAVVLLKPYSQIALANELLKNHISTSLDRHDYLLLLNNHLPKQHFRL